MRLIGHYQAGKQLSPELAFQPAPIPKFEGLQLPVAAGPTSPSRATFPAAALQPQNSGQGIRIPPLDPQKVAQYTGLFERSGAQNGVLDGQTAKAIFERAGLPVETLGKIWTLADREQRGALDQTEFILAMHLLTSMKSRTMTALPSTLPTGFYDAAARRGAPPPPPQARQPGGASRQFSGGTIGAPARTMSPLARGPYTGPPSAAQWLITPPDKAKYDQFFANIDTRGRGIISGEQAVGFFGDSGLSEEILASIWDLADINSEGQLNKDEFAVAMYLIRQQRAANAPPLPAFLPPLLVPPSMRKPGLQQQTQQTTAPAFEPSSKPTMPKSAADDLFGLDEPSQAPSQQPLAPTATGGSARDAFAPGATNSPSSPPRTQTQAAATSSTFKPFVPSSAFGASLAQQSTGGSQASASASQPRVMPQVAASRTQPSAVDDLLSDNDTGADERSKLGSDTTELANMSNQIGNLRSQMEQTQAKKTATQTDLNATAAQKQDLEARLQQFRAQYEQEIRTVKQLEQQLTASRESTKKLGQDLALLEGTYQDLQTQHQTIAQSLQADQAENANLKQRIAQLNSEVNRLKPEIEKLKLDARQQKGMVSINKKQLTTNETERDRLQGEKGDLEREAAEAEAARAIPTQRSPPATAKDVASPTGSTMSNTNPFFRKNPNDSAAVEQESGPGAILQGAPNPTAFDQLFGPAFNSDSKSPPPATSFVGRALPVAAGAAVGTVAGAAVGADLAESVSSDGKATPTATPPLSDGNHDVPALSEPPPPPEAGQFKPVHLPVGGLKAPHEEDSLSTSVVPPASRAGFSNTPGTSSAGAITPTAETVPGAFPSERGPSGVAEPPTEVSSDFDSAFADFGAGESSKQLPLDQNDLFATSFPKPPTKESNGVSSEFPPIQSLETEHDESDSEEDDDGDNNASRDFGNSFRPPGTNASQTEEVPALAGHQEFPVTSQPASNELPPITAQVSPPTYEQSEKKDVGRSASNDFPKEFTGLLPARENTDSFESVLGSNADVDTPRAVPVKQLSFPVNTPTSVSDVFHDASSRPLSSFTDEGAAGTSGQPNLDEAVRAPAAVNVFDEFDEFDDLAEAKEDEKAGGFDFGFSGHAQDDSGFNTAFDSSAPSTTTSRAPTAASGSLQDANGFTPTASVSTPFTTGGTADSAVQSTSNTQHDWDAIFSGLDNSKTDDLDTSFGNDPWTTTNGSNSTSTPAALSSQGKKAADMGRAVTPGTDHDDPILKRLTGMGYPRADALTALELYDYDISKVCLLRVIERGGKLTLTQAVDHLSTK